MHSLAVKSRTIDDVIANVPSPAGVATLPAPAYRYRDGGDGRGMAVGLAVESMKRHTTSEGFEVFAGLEHVGYRLCGHNLPLPYTDVREVLAKLDPTVVVVQDKREWMGRTAGPGFDDRERFRNVDTLRERGDVFRLTLLKDAQHDPRFHRDSADEIGAHAWVVYYSPRIVKHLAPYVREEHLIRTYHTVDTAIVPAFVGRGRAGCLLSGAVSGAYPLRQRLFANASILPDTTVMRHPGYGRTHCHTPIYLRALAQHKVAICTASVYGYALRKLQEATACGCVVITDLPDDEVLPFIDANLVRIPSTSSPEHVADVIRQCVATYNPERQEHYAALAREFYDYRASGFRLAHDIDLLRRHYAATCDVASTGGAP